MTWSFTICSRAAEARFSSIESGWNQWSRGINPNSTLALVRVCTRLSHHLALCKCTKRTFKEPTAWNPPWKAAHSERRRDSCTSCWTDPLLQAPWIQCTNAHSNDLIEMILNPSASCCWRHREDHCCAPRARMWHWPCALFYWLETECSIPPACRLGMAALSLQTVRWCVRGMSPVRTLHVRSSGWNEDWSRRRKDNNVSMWERVREGDRMVAKSRNAQWWPAPRGHNAWASSSWRLDCPLWG